MPVINSTAFIRRGELPPIGVADKFLLVSCEDLIELSVEAENTLPGDTYWWEQIGGSMVIWMTPRDQPTVVFDQNLVRDDKLFLVTIAAGTDRETHATVLVSAIPRDTVQWLSHPKLYQQNFNNETYRDGEIVFHAVMLPGLSPEGTVTVLNPNRFIAFDFPDETQVGFGVNGRPTLESTTTGYTLYDVTGGGMVEVASIGLSERAFFGLPSGREMKVVTNVRTQYPKFFEHQALGDVAGFFPWPGYLDADSWESSTTGVAHFGFATETLYPRSLVRCETEDEDGFHINLQQGKFTATEINYPRELIQQSLDDEDGFRINLQVPKFTMTRVQLNLGIGTIG